MSSRISSFKNISGVFFDLDNTLIFTRSSDKLAIKKVSFQYSFPNVLV